MSKQHRALEKGEGRAEDGEPRGASGAPRVTKEGEAGSAAKALKAEARGGGGGKGDNFAPGGLAHSSKAGGGGCVLASASGDQPTGCRARTARSNTFCKRPLSSDGIYCKLHSMMAAKERNKKEVLGKSASFHKQPAASASSKGQGKRDYSLHELATPSSLDSSSSRLGNSQSGGVASAKEATVCIAVTARGARCTFIAKPDCGGYCGLHYKGADAKKAAAKVRITYSSSAGRDAGQANDDKKQHHTPAAVAFAEKFLGSGSSDSGYKYRYPLLPRKGTLQDLPEREWIGKKVLILRGALKHRVSINCGVLLLLLLLVLLLLLCAGDARSFVTSFQ